MADQTNRREKPPGIFGIVEAVPTETRRGFIRSPDQQVTKFQDNGGELLKQAKVVLIFWGTAWKGNLTPSATAVINAVKSVLSSPYMFKLLQYRGIGNASLLATDIAGQSDPPNPFSDADVLAFLAQRMKSGAIPSSATTPDAFYCVIMPPGVTTSVLGSNGIPAMGKHLSWAGTTHWCWARNDGSLTDNQSITHVLTHELVEACTDPEPGSGIVVTAGGKDQEIGDVCNKQVQLIKGIGVQPYWSQFDGACDAPQARSVAWYLAAVLRVSKPVSLRALASARNTTSLLAMLSLPL